MSLYVVLKFLHLACVAGFVGGLIVVALLAGEARRTGQLALLAAAMRFNRRFVSPAFLLAVAFGLWLATHLGAFGDPWVQLKLVLLLVLGAVHGWFSGRLRRSSRDQGETLESAAGAAGFFPAMALAFAALAATMILLAVWKPLW